LTGIAAHKLVRVRTAVTRERSHPHGLTHRLFSRPRRCDRRIRLCHSEPAPI